MTATASAQRLSSPTGDDTANDMTTPQRSRVLTPVVVCGSPCVLPSSRDGQLLSPLLTAAAATAANNRTSKATLLQNNVPASESEKLTSTNIHVLHEIEQPRPRSSDIEATFCPPSVEIFRKAWWAGVRPTTCERTCRHRSKVCDAIQLCNDCTGYYCKWLAELVGIPVLKASGRVDPLLLTTDPLAKLYWERISKVACCPKTNLKCLMCIRRYQLFTHFLPGNLDFRRLVFESVMKLHEEGFAVDMGLIRKVTRRHLECIADSMELQLPVEYTSSYHAYDIIVRRGPLVDVLTNGLSSVLQSQGISSPDTTTRKTQQKSSDKNQKYLTNDSMRQTLFNEVRSLLASESGEGTKMEDGGYVKQGGSPNQDGERGMNKRRSRRHVKKPVYGGANEIYYGDEYYDFLSLLDDGVDDDDDHGRKKRRKEFRVPNEDSDGGNGELNGIDSLMNQFQNSSSVGQTEVSIDPETFQILCGDTSGRQAGKDSSWIPESRNTTCIVPDAKFNEQSKFELTDGSPEAIDRLAAAFLQRFDNQRSRAHESSVTVTESSHRQQLTEEIRLGQCGVKGVFWDPSKEGWCVLLPLLPSTTDIANVKRKILCFSMITWKSLESAKWSAVYERLRRNPVELDSLSQDVRQELSNWVRDNIENKNEGLNRIGIQSLNQFQSPLQQCSNNGIDLNQLDNKIFDLSNSKSSSDRLAGLLNSLSKHIANLDHEESVLQEMTTTSTAGVNDRIMTTNSEDQNDANDKSQLSTSIMNILATIQSRLPAEESQQQKLVIPQQIKTE